MAPAPHLPTRVVPPVKDSVCRTHVGHRRRVGAGPMPVAIMLATTAGGLLISVIASGVLWQ